MANVNVYCPRGHLYDSSLPACPYCSPNSGKDLGATEPLNSGGVGETLPLRKENQQPTPPPNQGNIGPTEPVNQNSRNDRTMGKTVFAGDLNILPNASKTQINIQQSVRPVVGWLVCVQGDDLGKDFRLHSHFNHVGRGEDQDVRLTDKSISRQHFTVSYDMLNDVYFAEMGRGQTFVYINGQPLGARTILNKGDRIRVGETMLVFIPLDRQCVQWNWKL